MSVYVNTLIGVGCPPELANVIDLDHLTGTRANNITAAGTTQGTATELAAEINNVNTVAAGTGVKLYDAKLGSWIVVTNNGANPLNVYSHNDSSSINSVGFGGLVALVLPPGSGAICYHLSTATWTAVVSDFGAAASNTLTAAGTIITDALDLVTPYNNVTTAATGSGVQLYEAAIGQSITVRNGGNGTCLVYPPTASGTINQLTAGTGYMLPAQSVAIFTKIAATVWVAALGAVQGVENGITATGTGAGDAFALSRFVNGITGGGAATGVILPAATTVPVGVPVWVNNSSGANKTIYPPSGGTINGDASVVIADNTGVACIRLTSTVWYSF